MSNFRSGTKWRRSNTPVHSTKSEIFADGYGILDAQIGSTCGPPRARAVLVGNGNVFNRAFVWCFPTNESQLYYFRCISKVDIDLNDMANSGVV